MSSYVRAMSPIPLLSCPDIVHPKRYYTAPQSSNGTSVFHHRSKSAHILGWKRHRKTI
ncbi:hypothetical protein MAR_002616 [Mya arenaria]|uniref:Uncharacterized protein n=1 Tax=Mya arenaria TaxID=6604 RepID=A0ABY7G767_MYAAR|nr:hypothetical protein MAR_002616 [Mya arenaria]